VSLTIELDSELERRVREIAAREGEAPEEVAAVRVHDAIVGRGLGTSGAANASSRG
jgi:hypothetical protein